MKQCSWKELADAHGLAGLQCTQQGVLKELADAKGLASLQYAKQGFLKELASAKGLGHCTPPCAWHSMAAGRDMWLANRLCVCCSYEGHDQWATNGSIKLEHFLQLDTGQSSVQHLAAAVLQFLTQRKLLLAL